MVGPMTNKDLQGDMNKFISEFVPWVNEKINEGDGKIITRIKDVKKDMGAKFENISDRELYWTLKLRLYNEWIVTNRGIHKDGDILIIFRIATPGDMPPVDFSINEETVPGIDYIREMEDYNKFNSKKVVEIIEENKDIIKDVDSTRDNDGVAITLKSEDKIDRKRLIEGIIEMADEFCADQIDYNRDTDVIIFGWD